MIRYEAAELAAQTQTVPRIVRRSFAQRPIEELRVLAGALTQAGCTVLLGTAGERTQLVFASPAGSPVDCARLLRETVAQFGGRGGGQATLAQGGLPDSGQLDAALDVALARVIEAMEGG